MTRRWDPEGHETANGTIVRPRRRRRVVVTGVAGFVGSHVAEALIARGDEVVGVDGFVGAYSPAIKRENLRALMESPSFTFHELDLRCSDMRPVLEGADAVINEAALAGLSRSWADVSAYMGCNVTGLSRLLEASEDAGVGRFIQVSTSSVYGLRAVGDETQPTEPVSPYGVSKLAAEKLVLAHAHVRGLPATILRYFSIYGPRQRPDMAYHIFVEALRDGRPIVVFGDGWQSRTNTYVADCVRGTLAALDGGEVGETYNIGGGVPLRLREAIDIIADQLGCRPTIVQRPVRPGDQRETAADFSKARDHFGYAPTVDPVAGLGLQIDWHVSELARVA
jgi:nucleoside-diphosphate-sugar epimerase